MKFERSSTNLSETGDSPLKRTHRGFGWSATFSKLYFWLVGRWSISGFQARPVTLPRDPETNAQQQFPLARTKADGRKLKLMVIPVMFKVATFLELLP